MIDKILTKFAVFGILLLIVVGCHRQTLEESFDTKALIPVLIDWESMALMDVENDPEGDLYSASVWLFPAEGGLYQGAPIEYKLTNPVYSYIEVPVGVYDVLVFNKTVGEYSTNVGFSGTDKFETFEYYTNPYVSQGRAVSVDDKEARLEPDLLAAWRSTPTTQLVVTLDMVESRYLVTECQGIIETKFFTNRVTTSKVISKDISVDDFSTLGSEFKQLLNLTPERITHIITVETYVDNLHSASAATGIICGMSGSAKLAGAEYSEEQTSQYYSFESKYITSDDGKDGYMTADFRVMGYINTSTLYDYDMKATFTLVDLYEDSYTYPSSSDDAFTFAVTSQVYDGAAVMELDKTIPLVVADDIALPDLSVGGDGGFDVSVGSWDDEIDVPITL